MRRHLRFPKRFNILTASILLVVLGIVGTVGWYANHRANSNSNTKQTSRQAPKPVYHKPSDPVSAAADSFIISKVGQDRFLQYFKAIEQTAPANPATANIKTYHFTPLKKVTQDDTLLVVVNMKNKALTVTNLLPDCQQDKSYCDFKVTKEQALAIAKKRSFNPPDLKISWDKQGYSALAIKLTSCTENKVMLIDYRNGKVLDFRSDPSVCPKVNPLISLPSNVR